MTTHYHPKVLSKQLCFNGMNYECIFTMMSNRYICTFLFLTLPHACLLPDVKYSMSQKKMVYLWRHAYLCMFKPERFNPPMSPRMRKTLKLRILMPTLQIIYVFLGSLGSESTQIRTYTTTLDFKGYSLVFGILFTFKRQWMTMYIQSFPLTTVVIKFIVKSAYNYILRLIGPWLIQMVPYFIIMSTKRCIVQ